MRGDDPQCCRQPAYTCTIGSDASTIWLDRAKKPGRALFHSSANSAEPSQFRKSCASSGAGYGVHGHTHVHVVIDEAVRAFFGYGRRESANGKIIPTSWLKIEISHDPAG